MNRQSFITILLTIFMSMIGVKAFAHDIEAAYKGKTIYYVWANNNTELAVSYRGSSISSFSNEYTGNVVIPESVDYNGNTYPVTSIGDWAFEGCCGLTSVTIPKSVISIDEYAFSGCSDLTSMTIPNSVTSIGESAFYGCSGLTSVTIPNSVTSIGSGAFGDCSGLTSVTIPNGVSSIKRNTFHGCSGLTSVTIPNSVTSIGSWAFEGCCALTSVTIPNSVTSIGHGVFDSCSGLTSVTIGNSVTSIGETAFYGCSGLTSVTIGNSVTSIGETAFYGCSGLTSVHISDIKAWCGITFSEFESNPLYYAKHLYLNGEEVKELVIPNSVKSIGQYAFSYCSGLTSVTIPSSVTSIGIYAFYGCSGLTSINVESGNQHYGSRNNCNAIIETASNTLILGCKNTTIPNSVKSIGQYAFSYCSGLTSVTIPNSVTSIGDYAFENCSGLTSVAVNCCPTTIGYTPFHNCTKIEEVSFDCETVTSIFSGFSSIKKVTLSENVKTIGQSAFYNCSALTSVAIPNSVASIGEKAFDGTAWYNNQPDGLVYIGKVSYKYKGEMPANTKITIKDGTLGITGYAFSGYYNLSSVTIPNSVTSIGNYAFNKCSGLTTIYSGIESPFKIGNIASTSVILFVPVGTKAAYQSTAGWSSFTNILEVGEGGSVGSKYDIDGIFYTIGKNYTASLTSANTAISGAVEIPSQVEFNGKNYSVTSIGNNAFGNCSGLTSVTIPNSVKSIGDKAFGNCSGLTSVIIGSGVLSIGSDAFYNKKSRKTIWLTNTPPSGYDYAKGTVNYVSNDQFNISNKVVYKFLSSHFVVDGIRYVPVSPSDRTCDAIDCTYDASIENINIGETVTNKEVTLTVKKVNPFTCYGNKHIKDVNLGLRGEIGDYAFYGCNNLESVELGQNIPSIGSSAFEECSKLKSIVIPDAVTSLGSYAFQSCSAMTSAKIGNGIETINEYTFSGCSSLKEIIIGSKVKIINEGAFSNCSSLPALTIPEAVTTIGYYAFYYCKRLAKVNIADSETTLTLGSNGSSPIFSSCPLDYVYIGRDISYETSSGYGYSPFYRNTSLRAVKITDSEMEISENEFYGCTNLQQVEIGDGVTSIGNWAFSGCSSLKYFAFGTQVKTIGKEAFSDCTAVTKIISKANTPPACGSQALDDINKWECKLSVPQGRKAIYQAAEQWKEFFYIEEGTDDPVIPDTPKTDKDGVTYVADGDLAVVSTGLSAKGEVKICDMVEINGKSYQVTTIAEGAFKDNSEITFVDIPNTVESIGMSAFEGCTNLGIIHIGEGVKQIASRAFANVYSNRTRTRSGEKKLEVYCYAEDVPNTAEDVFDGSPTESSILHVPAKAFKAYKDMSPWNKFKEIVALNNSTALTDKGILFSMKDDGTLEVTGLEEETKTVDILSSVTINDIEYQVTSIGKRAFEGRDDIEYLSIPWSVKSIGEFAFIDCGNNITVNIADPESWCQMELGNEHSSPLACAKKVLVFDIETDNIIIPEGVTFIGNYTFYQCRCIKSLTIPSTVTFIGSSAFEGCTGLTSLTLNEGLESVGGSAFEGCSGLQTLTIPSTVNTISINAFAGCKGITDVYCLAEDVPNTDENAFNGTPTEKSTLHVPANVVEAYRAAWPWSDFKEIVALTDVGIMKVRSDDDNGEYFDLYGRKVYQPQKGLNIFRRHDGKIVKILVK